MLRNLNNENLNDINGGLIVKDEVLTTNGRQTKYLVYKDKHLSLDRKNYNPNKAIEMYDDYDSARDAAKKHGQSKILIDLYPDICDHFVDPIPSAAPVVSVCEKNRITPR